MNSKSILYFLFFLMPSISIAMEICDNGIDDDNDGLIDLNDDDCQCQDVLDDTVFIPNGDFESSQTCCPQNNFSEINCLDNWVPVNGSAEYIDPACYTDLEAEEASLGIPITNEFIGLNYNETSFFEFKETFGVCTTQPLQAGFKYRLEFDVRFTPKEEHNAGAGNPHLVFYGLKDCTDLAFTEPTFGDLCELGFELFPLDSIAFDDIPFDNWRSIQRNFTSPENLNAIIVGYECLPDGEVNVSRFLFLDNISISRLLNEAFAFNLDVSSIGALCEDNFSISIPDRSEFDYQWYKDGIAIIDAKNNTLSIDKDEASNGIYQARLTNAEGCVVTEEIEISAQDLSVDTTLCLGTSLTLSTGTYLEPGSYIDEAQSEFSCETVMYDLDFNEIIRGDTIIDSFQKDGSYLFAGQQYDNTGVYDLSLIHI